MSLETLLEAAEFLESRGRDGDRLKYRTISERRSGSFSEISPFQDESDSNGNEEKIAKDLRLKRKSGKMSPMFVEPSDKFFTCMRAGTREVHNKLEKNRLLSKGKEILTCVNSAHNRLERNRRAHLKECFSFLKKNIPNLEDKRTSNLGILRSSLRYIQNLKRREREYEQEMQKFAREKILLQERMRGLKDELHNMNIEVDLNAWVATSQDHDNETNSTSTATERGTPPPSDFDENDDDEEEAERLVLETNPSPIPKHKTAPNTVNHVRPIVPLALSKAPVTLNGLTPKVNQILLKSPPKKTIPITLSLSGPVPPVDNMQGNVPETVNISRTPVTQLLHRTLTQRQALQKQMKTTSIVSTTPKSPPVARTIIPLSITSVNSQPVTTGIPKVELPTNMPTNIMAAPVISTTTTFPTSKQTSTVSTSNPLNLSYYMASMQKLNHPILVTSLMAPAVGLTSSSTISSPALTMATSTHSTSSIAQKPELVLGSGTTLPSQTQLNFLNTSVVTTPVTQTDVKTTSANVPIRPIFTPNLISGWPLLTTIPRSSVVVPSSNVAVTHTVNTVTPTSAVSSVPLVSLTQLNQLTQIMTPMTVMSPGIQMTQSTINPSQINSMFATSPLLKQILPLGIPSSLLQSGQVLGQMKPVVVVTVPNVVTQTPVTLANVVQATTTS